MNRPHRKKNDEKRNAPLFLVFFHFLFFFTLGGFGGGGREWKGRVKEETDEKKKKKEEEEEEKWKPRLPATHLAAPWIFAAVDVQRWCRRVVCCVCGFFFPKNWKTQKNKQTNKQNKTQNQFLVFGFRFARSSIVFCFESFRFPATTHRHRWPWVRFLP